MSTTIESASHPAPVRRPLWRRLLGFNLLSAVVLGVGGYYLGWFIGHQVSTSKSFEFINATYENDVALLLAYLFGVAGFLIGLGFANYPVSRLLGRPASLREKEDEGIGRYFGLCTDHKVVGIQYLVGIGLFFFVGGLGTHSEERPAGSAVATGRRIFAGVPGPGPGDCGARPSRLPAAGCGRDGSVRRPQVLRVCL